MKCLLCTVFLLPAIFFNCSISGHIKNTTVYPKHGTISFIFKNKEYRSDAVLIKTAADSGYAINTVAGMQGFSIVVLLPETAAGKYPFGTGNLQSSMFIDNSNYLLNDGFIITRVNGKLFSGTFKVKYFSTDGKGGYNKVPAGEISGAFNQIIIP